MPVGATFVEQAFLTEGLRPMEQIVLLRLAYYADFLEVCRPSINRLVAETGAARSTVFEALKSLEEKGLVVRLGRDTTTIYQLFPESSTWTIGGSTGETRPAPGPEHNLHRYRGTTYLSNTSYLRRDRPSGSTAGKTRKTSEEDMPQEGQPQEDRSPVRKGWKAAREAIQAEKKAREKARRTPQDKPVMHRTDRRVEQAAAEKQARKKCLAQHPATQKDPAMHPGQLDDDRPTKTTRSSKRNQIDDFVSGNAVGKVEDEPKKPTSRPVEQWKATDLYKHLKGWADIKAPSLREQVNRGWALGDFRKWLDAGTPAEVIKATIDDFVKDPRNMGGSGTLTIWQKYRVYFINHQEAALRRYESSKTSIQDEIQEAREANAGAHSRLKALAEAARAKQAGGTK